MQYSSYMFFFDMQYKLKAPKNADKREGKYKRENS
jgi:hypothetical protein